MKKVKEICKLVGSHLWDLLKGALMPMFFYGMLSSICFMGTMNEEWTGDVAEGLNGSRIAWVVIIALIAAAYHGVLAYAMGGKGYEMLVSGNMKRISAQQLGSSYRISSHKEVQEYRAWKGFASGAWIAIFTLIFGLLMGANGDKVNDMLLTLSGDVDTVDTSNKAASAVALISMLLSGWSVMLFAFLNIGGVTVSYYWSCLFALIPVLVCGFFYIAGAYGKRASSIKAQEEADRAAAAAAVAKPKKINYGGLPGTKPKKRKK